MDATEEQRCAGLIKAAFYEKWHPRPPWTMDLKKMTLHVEFDKQGRVKAFRLTGSSGDAAADRTVLSAARSVGRVSGLTAAYLERHGVAVCGRAGRRAARQPHHRVLHGSAGADARPCAPVRAQRGQLRR